MTQTSTDAATCRYAETHGVDTCGGPSNGLYCMNHAACRNGCDHVAP